MSLDVVAKRAIARREARSVRIQTGVPVALRDGTTLRADVYSYRLSLHPTSILFRPGHRVRIDSSSSDFPKYDRNHNTGGNDWQEAELRTARQRVFHDANRASRVHFPTILS